jgi:DNA-directed RNA polymerase specialized sigma24 family protein
LVTTIPFPVEQEEPRELSDVRWAREVWSAIYHSRAATALVVRGHFGQVELFVELIAEIMQREADGEVFDSRGARNRARSKISALYKYHKRRETISLDAENDTRKGKATLTAAVWDDDNAGSLAPVKGHTPRAEKSMLSVESKDLFRDSLETLTPMERRTIHLYYLDCEPPYPSIEDIAAMLRETVDATKKRLLRAKEKLRQAVYRKYHEGIYDGIPKQNHRLSQYFDEYARMLADCRASLLGGTVPAYDETKNETIFAERSITISSGPRCVTGAEGRQPCANPACKNEIIFFPVWVDCPLCAMLQRFALGTNCSFCLVENVRRKYCKACARDEDFIRVEWERRALSKRFTTFERWDSEARAYIQGWCFDLTHDGLRNTPRSTVWREAHMEGAVNLVVYRDQPVFELVAQDAPEALPVTLPAQLALEAPRDAAFSLRPVVHTEEDRLHLQTRAMLMWQERARKKFEAFKRQHKGMSRQDALSLFAAAHPDVAKLVSTRLCRRCGLPVNVEGYVCTACREQ